MDGLSGIKPEKAGRSLRFFKESLSYPKSNDLSAPSHRHVYPNLWHAIFDKKLKLRNLKYERNRLNSAWPGLILNDFVSYYTCNTLITWHVLNWLSFSKIYDVGIWVQKMASNIFEELRNLPFYCQKNWHNICVPGLNKVEVIGSGDNHGFFKNFWNCMSHHPHLILV